jgi:hypothetical protein
MKIRQIASLVAAVVFTAVSAAPAFAVTVSRVDGQPINPNGEPFSATGAMNLGEKGVSAVCMVTINGTISASGIVSITSTELVGGAMCKLFAAPASSASPWTGQFDSTTQLSINNAQMTFPVLGACGPGKVSTTWRDPDSSITFMNAELAPDCRLAGTLVTSPKLHVQ